MQPFQRPTVRDESRSEVVEKFGMSRFLSLSSEVARRRDQAAAEVLRPNSIDDNTRDKWSRIRHDRIREFQTPAADLERILYGNAAKLLRL